MRIAHLNCERAIGGFDVCLLRNRASFINECQISTLGVSLSVHTSVIPVNICPGLWVGPPRNISGFDIRWLISCTVILCHKNSLRNFNIHGQLSRQLRQLYVYRISSVQHCYLLMACLATHTYRRRHAFWCLLCLVVTDKRLYVVAKVVDPRYPRRLFGVPNLVCAKQWLLLQTQLGRMPRPRSRWDHQRNVSALTTHSRTYRLYWTPVWTSFSRRLINDNRKKSNFWFRESNIRKKRF